MMIMQNEMHMIRRMPFRYRGDGLFEPVTDGDHGLFQPRGIGHFIEGDKFEQFGGKVFVIPNPLPVRHKAFRCERVEP